MMRLYINMHTRFLFIFCVRLNIKHVRHQEDVRDASIPAAWAIIFIFTLLREAHLNTCVQPPACLILFISYCVRLMTNSHRGTSTAASWPDRFLIFLWVPLDDAYA